MQDIQALLETHEDTLAAAERQLRDEAEIILRFAGELLRAGWSTSAHEAVTHARVQWFRLLDDAALAKRVAIAPGESVVAKRLLQRLAGRNADDLTESDKHAPVNPAVAADIVCWYLEADNITLTPAHWERVVALRKELGRPLDAAEVRSIVDANGGLDDHR